MRLFGCARLPAAALPVAELLMSGAVSSPACTNITAILYGRCVCMRRHESATGGIDVFRDC